MSNIYITEPPTNGKVVLHTSFGDVDIELWPKEAPKAVRNFIQLAIDGYYDGTIFHRIIKDFMVQGGDPTGTGRGGESIYGGGFPDEIHQRLKFNHRGQVAMANENSPSTNNSQFFITLGKCDWLNGKHTIFGKVTGATIFNVLRAGEFATDKNDFPLEPPTLKSIEVLANPFADVVQRRKAAVPQPADDDTPRRPTLTDGKKKKKKKKRNLGLLSFGEEAGAELAEAKNTGRTGIKSTHDAAIDPRLRPEAAYDGPSKPVPDGGTASGTESRPSMKVNKDQQAKAFAEAMRQRIHSRSGKRATHKRKTVTDEGSVDSSSAGAKKPSPVAAAKEGDKPSSDGDSSDEERSPASKRRREAASETKRELKRQRRELASSSSAGRAKAVKVTTGTKLQAQEDEQLGQGKEGALLAPLQAARAKYVRRKQRHGNRESDTLAKLAAFKNKFRAALKDDSGAKEPEAVSYSGQLLDDGGDDDDNDAGWMRGSLKFVKHIDDTLRRGSGTREDPLANQHKKVSDRRDKRRDSRRDKSRHRR